MKKFLLKTFLLLLTLIVGGQLLIPLGRRLQPTPSLQNRGLLLLAVPLPIGRVVKMEVVSATTESKLQQPLLEQMEHRQYHLLT